MAREIIFFGDNVIDFYKSQDSKVQLKIEYVLDLVRFERQIPIKFFKKLESTDGIYEVRIITSQKSIRILCVQDEGTLVILTNAFVKKTQKTPKNEINLAENLKTEYLKQKKDERR
ncbi:type II toxin-antitoxin system RelE/ParE family toxin [Marnyiella aurantia]|uniref:Type II toxin-antitoxin system RelE/ParE family toxin n=1 Tax=Marnyiella aurantia TaxID=2758037 RepID=A0A7D7QKD7_9FLAO|nr:type II toxin-antitoxin system RelE/ParE family toxin [Marnyiella aurantia]MBA5246407.1 type II toxin-antitoxin system RelE/ParE family toxin [Marnyiella aurantia]QMS98225.1 type II toxin-antitoxin system RelE/ParE family toxin [Marnyiella aurantia]